MTSVRILHRARACRGRRGFTLIELIVVLLMLLILTTIGVMTYTGDLTDASGKLAIQEAYKVDAGFRAAAVASDPTATDPLGGMRQGPDAPARNPNVLPDVLKETAAAVVLESDFATTGHASVTIDNETACLTVGATAGTPGQVAATVVDGNGPCVTWP